MRSSLSLSVMSGASESAFASLRLGPSSASSRTSCASSPSVAKNVTHQHRSVFRWWLAERGRKFEEKQLKYALYSQVVREGGLRVPCVMRFSLIPSHCEEYISSLKKLRLLTPESVVTAIFATTGMSVWYFIISALFGLPKQLALVYIGVNQNEDGCGFSTISLPSVYVLPRRCHTSHVV